MKGGGVDGARILRRTCKAVKCAAQHLRPHDAAAAHEVRKELKRARAGLRLLRPALQAGDYRSANRALRDSARPLMRLRDAQMLLDTLDDLIVRADVATAQALRAARPALQLRLARSQADVDAARVIAVSKRLRRCRRRLRRLALSPRGPALRQALRRLYGRGRHAFGAARRTADAPTLHEWRKQVKYLANALVLLQPRECGSCRRARRLAHVLGQDHDIAVLFTTLRRMKGQLPAEAMDRLAALCERRRRVLEARIMGAAKELFARKPRCFARSIL